MVVTLQFVGDAAVIMWRKCEPLICDSEAAECSCTHRTFRAAHNLTKLLAEAAACDRLIVRHSQTAAAELLLPYEEKNMKL